MIGGLNQSRLESCPQRGKYAVDVRGAKKKEKKNYLGAHMSTQGRMNWRNCRLAIYTSILNVM